MHTPSIAFMIILLVIVVLLFGGGKVAKLGGELGIAIKEFRKGLNGEEESAPVAPVVPTAPTAPVAQDQYIKSEIPPSSTL
jgi:sec-independent protein translocase protein TatA